LQDIEAIKNHVCDEVEALRTKMIQINDWLYDHPELGSEEYQSSEYLTAILERKKFVVHRGTARIPTAFTASFGEGSPKVAFLAEYDALPGVGHGCGHNMIAASAVGAGIAVSKALSHPGTVKVIGTPDEEARGKYGVGKALLVKAGVFRDVDVALMMHGGTKYSITRPALAAQYMQITFKGRISHAAASPEKGINALDAAILTYVGVNTLRQHVRRNANVVIHGVIVEGGKAANVIPGLAVLKYGVRSTDNKYVPELVEKIKRCARGAAMTTGAKVEFDAHMPMFEAVKHNTALEELVVRNLRSLGVRPEEPEATRGEMPEGSNDLGNVSQVVPAVSITTKICPAGTPGHSAKMREATKSAEGRRGMITATKTMAMCALELMLDRALLKSVKTVHSVGRYHKKGENTA